MAPLVCPEEVDVFKNPHIRMKQIISVASEQISTANFRDKVSLYGLLSSFYGIFLELKHHEEVENSCIMKTLQGRLTDEQIRAIVKDVHKHSHVRQILALIKKGIKNKKKKKTLLNMVNYETKLRTAVDEFEREIFPHMKHEEEVFQPLLMEHFSFEELKSIKEKVDCLHSAFFECNSENTPTKTSTDNKDSYSAPPHYYPSTDSDTTDNEIENVRSQISNIVRTISAKDTKPLVLGLPPELLIKIFGYLSPKDLCRTSQVCKRWSVLAKDGQLWRVIYPVRWIFKNDWRFGDVDDGECMCNSLDSDDGLEFGFKDLEIRSSYADADADFDESGDSEDSCYGASRSQMHSLLGITKYLLPVVGKSVQILKMACCPLLSNGLVYKMLSHCPNLEHLDISQTAISDYGLKGLFRRGGGSQLKILELSGCRNITDKALMSLSCALGEASNADIEEGMCECTSACKCANKSEQQLDARGKRSLVHLSLSGCYQITDVGLRSLTSNGGLPKLEFLDLSGCLNVTAYGLGDLVFVCPTLDHAQFYYCDNIDKGPYHDTASGCQNLECTNRVCCRTGE